MYAALGLCSLKSNEKSLHAWGGGALKGMETRKPSWLPSIYIDAAGTAHTGGEDRDDFQWLWGNQYSCAMWVNVLMVAVPLTVMQMVF